MLGGAGGEPGWHGTAGVGTVELGMGLGLGAGTVEGPGAGGD